MQRKEDISNQPTFSRVVLAIPTQKKWVKPIQTHQNIRAIYQVNKPLDVFFNDILHNQDNVFDIYGFLKPNFWFNYDNSIEQIVKKFQQFPKTCAIYTDEETKKIEYFESFNQYISPFNTSLFINGLYSSMLRFDSDRPFENAILQMTQKGLLMIHLAEPLLKAYE